jgi:hypothetical protein
MYKTDRKEEILENDADTIESTQKNICLKKRRNNRNLKQFRSITIERSEYHFYCYHYELKSFASEIVW